jgi:hypothetical protein
MDRVGFEPTTSAMLAFFYLRAAMERELKCSRRVRWDAAENSDEFETKILLLPK